MLGAQAYFGAPFRNMSKLFLNRETILDFLICLSLSNLCFLFVWRELIFASPSDLYFLPDFYPASYYAILINVGLLSGILDPVGGDTALSQG